MCKTYFAPPERTDRRKLRNQIESISINPVITTLLTTMAGLLVILNDDRQIVALNRDFLDTLGLKDPEEALGLRLGETLKCIHCKEPPAGCGTTPFCVTCGAAIAMMTAIREDKPDERICSVTIEQNGTLESLCMIVKAKPLSQDGNHWTLVFVQDITQQNFWINLERVFFHDIRNILGTLMASAELLSMDFKDNPLVDSVLRTSYRLKEEISIQNVLANDRNISHLFRKAKASVGEIREDLELLLSRHPLTHGRSIEYQWPENDLYLNTVSLLVSKVLGNMMINAMEAGKEGDIIRLSSTVTQDAIRFDVWNSQFIPENIQLRIFQRHFSTKEGSGRGLGTYSMKIFGEKYLHGTVDFVSRVNEGTTFSLTLPR